MDSTNRKWNLVKMRLEKLDARTIAGDHEEGDRLQLSTDWVYQITKKTQELAVISAKCRTRFIPQGLFEVTTEFTLVYKMLEDLSQDDLDQEMERLLHPAGGQNALLVAQVTDKIRGNPLVISPRVRLKKDGMNLN